MAHQARQSRRWYVPLPPSLPPSMLPFIHLTNHPSLPPSLPPSDSRLVYAPHIYGPSVYEHSYMKGPDFPNNLPAVSVLPPSLPPSIPPSLLSSDIPFSPFHSSLPPSLPPSDLGKDVRFHRLHPQS